MADMREKIGLVMFGLPVIVFVACVIIAAFCVFGPTALIPIALIASMIIGHELIGGKD